MLEEGGASLAGFLASHADMLIDLFFFGLILLLVVGERFGQWPESYKKNYSGPPRDYIDSFRYSLFYAGYLATFLLFVLIIRNLGVNFIAELPGMDEAPDYGHVSALFGSNSYTYIALILIAAMNVPRIRKYDETWRSKLQTWALIPRAVEDACNQLRGRSDALQPEKHRLNAVLEDQGNTADTEYWRGVADNLEAERARNALSWRCIRGHYLLSVVMDIGLHRFNYTDVRDTERQLDYIAKVLPGTEENSDVYIKLREDLEALDTRLCEAICKFIIRKYPAKTEQYEVFRNYGLCLKMEDSVDIKLLRAVFVCTLGITLICGLGVFAYLAYRTHLQVQYQIGGPTLDGSRLVRWTLASAYSYVVAILIGIFLDKISQRNEVAASITVYMAAILLSTIASYTYFGIASIDVGSGLARHLAFASLALGFGVFSAFVISSLNNEAITDQRDILHTAVRHAVLLGLITGLLQLSAQLGFSYSSGHMQTLDLVSAATVSGFLFGAFKGLLIGGFTSYFIQDNVRRQLAAAMRVCPRKRHLARVHAQDGERERVLLIRNISRTGLKVYSRDMSDNISSLKLLFPFATINANVVWRKGRTAGLRFAPDDPNLTELQSFIRERYGQFYA